MPKPQLTLVRPPGIASTNPADFHDDFDAISAATRSIYRGDEILNLYRLPSYIRTNIRRVLRHGKTIDIGPLCSALTEHGIHRLASTPGVRALEALYAEAETTAIPSAAAIEIDRWRSCTFILSDPHHSGPCRFGFRTPESIRNELFALSGDLGLSGSVLGGLCLITALCDQPGVLADHAQTMREDINALDSLLTVRAKRLEVILEMVRKGAWG